MRRNITGKILNLFKIFVIVLALSMCASVPVYAVEEAEQEVEAEEEEEEAEEGAEEAPQEAPQETPPAATTNTTTRRTTSRTGNTASTAASSAASAEASEENADEGALDVSVPDLEITNGKYTLTLTKNANMRAEASTGADSRIVIPFGMTLDSDKRVVNGSGEVWYEVTYATLTGYIREDLVDVQTVAVEEPQETEEAAEGDGEESQEEAILDAVSEAAAETAATEHVATPHDAINSDKNVQSETETDIKIEETTGADEAVKVKSRKKFDFVVLLFLVMIGIGIALVIAVLNLLKAEAKRSRDAYRRYMKKEKKTLFQNIEE